VFSRAFLLETSPFFLTLWPASAESTSKFGFGCLTSKLLVCPGQHQDSSGLFSPWRCWGSCVLNQQPQIFTCMCGWSFFSSHKYVLSSSHKCILFSSYKCVLFLSCQAYYWQVFRLRFMYHLFFTDCKYRCWVLFKSVVNKLVQWIWFLWAHTVHTYLRHSLVWFTV
jgi:hypothetical protein